MDAANLTDEQIIQSLTGDEGNQDPAVRDTVMKLVDRLIDAAG